MCLGLMHEGAPHVCMAWLPSLLGGEPFKSQHTSWWALIMTWLPSPSVPKETLIYNLCLEPWSMCLANGEPCVVSREPCVVSRMAASNV